MGLDPKEPNLKDTPKRVAKMYCQEIFSNVGTEFHDFKSFPNDKHYEQIIMLDNIEFTSTCSHHFLPFRGLAWLLYIPKPDGVLIGASKPARLIEHYSKRPQIQENLCRQVLLSFVLAIKPQGAMVVMRATHACMQCRGVKQGNNAGMTTSALYGNFYEQSVKMEALELIKVSMR